MMRMTKWAALALALACAFGCHRETPLGYGKQGGVQKKDEPITPPSTDVGKPMPAYAASTLDGKPFDLAAEKGEVVFLNVWATWCGPCRAEIPELKKMQSAYASRGFKVIGVSVDEGGPEQVKDFVKEEGVTYPIALDAEGRIANLLQTTVLPTSLLIDRSGTIVWRQVGQIEPNDEGLANALKKALAKKS